LRYLIFGSGAVGSYLGVSLALAGHPVGFLAREHTLKTLRDRGFSLLGNGLPKALHHPAVYSDAAQAISAEKPDLILLTVKAYDVVDAARTLAPLLHESQSVVSFLNGINNESTLIGELGEARVLPATLTTAVQSPEPGTIRVARVRGIGLAGSHPQIEPFQKELKNAGFLVRSYTNPDRMKWSKLLTNIVSNASSAILGWTAKQVFDHPLTAQLEINALREAVEVMRRCGHTPQNLPGVQVAILGRAVYLPSALTRKLLGLIVNRGRGEKKPSLHYDIGRGRSEIAWLNGAVTNYGRKLGVPTPINQMLTQTLLDLVHKRRSHEEFMNQPGALIQRVST
jgi:2-dehydropantoate 2-reductase